MCLRSGLGLLLAGIVGVYGSNGSVRAEPVTLAPLEPRADKVPSFKADVMPILTNSCINCHNDKKKKGGVDISSYEAVMKSVKASDADKSRLVKSVLGKGAKLMPPKKGLGEDQVAIIKAWIAAGAKND